jgi:hypothetical protein
VVAELIVIQTLFYTGSRLGCSIMVEKGTTFGQHHIQFHFNELFHVHFKILLYATCDQQKKQIYIQDATFSFSF